MVLLKVTSASRPQKPYRNFKTPISSGAKVGNFGFCPLNKPLFREIPLTAKVTLIHDVLLPEPVKRPGQCPRMSCFMPTQPSRDEIFQRIHRLATTLLMLPDDQIQATSRLREDLGADSLFITQLLLTLEDDFKVKIDEADSEHFVTLDSITDYVMGKLGAN
jgi:acyl carrier protein